MNQFHVMDDACENMAFDGYMVLPTQISPRGLKMAVAASERMRRKVISGEHPSGRVYDDFLRCNVNVVEDIWALSVWEDAIFNACWIAFGEQVHAANVAWLLCTGAYRHKGQFHRDAQVADTIPVRERTEFQAMLALTDDTILISRRSHSVFGPLGFQAPTRIEIPAGHILWMHSALLHCAERQPWRRSILLRWGGEKAKAQPMTRGPVWKRLAREAMYWTGQYK